MFINRYKPIGGGGCGGGWGGGVILVQHNLSIIPPIEHDFEHKTLVSRVTPENIILYFSSIISAAVFLERCVTFQKWSQNRKFRNVRTQEFGQWI